MKEATGELSMTAIVVVILGIIAVVAPIIIRTVGNTMKMKLACQSAYGCDTGTACTYDDTTGRWSGNTKCSYQDEEGTEKEVTCNCTDVLGK